ncbi:protein NLP7 isoform X1 [Daucus carota subsp. sativus]|uniref:protein NLP7 isoform X1 n=1 Tax=Daucus carota subsp. sativus TaxID=79200 RepID=UPI0007EF6DF8|nr:PREDICTED: protein NLP7-like isoform X1 [Daucus carota subsp. sativus]
MGLGNDHENQSNTQLREKIFVYLERFYCSIIEKTQSSGNILVQFWVADIVTRAKGRQYCELRTQSQLFYHDQSDDRRLLSYRNHVVARSFRVSAGQEEDEGDDENWQELLGITGSVFKNKKAEVSPRISHYSTDEYPERDFALSCGIQASLCLPLFATDDFSGHPNGVIELVFTSEEDFHHLKPYIYYYYSVHSTLRMPEVKSILRSNISCISISPDILNEIDHVLAVVSETFQVPLAQCWLSRDHSVGEYTVINQKGSLDYNNLVPWSKFKEACLQSYLDMGDGLVGRTFMSHTAFFCSEITKLSIRSYPLAHYLGNCGSVDCFTMCLHNYTTGDKDYVIEFFLPHEQMDSQCPESLLNSLLETLRQHFKTFVLASGEKLGTEMSVKVIDSFMYHESESFKIVCPNLSFPRQKIQQPGRGVSWLTPSAWKLQWDTDTNFLLSVPCLSPLGSPKRLDQNVQVIETSGSSNSFSEDVSKTEIPTRMKINRNVLTEESPGEESQPLTFQSKKTIPRQEGKEGTQLLDPLAQQLVLDDALQSQKKGLALGMENFNTDIHIVNKTRIEVTSDRENNSEESISFENLRKHFGRPLDDAAKSFGVSRSTFKRVCRDHGIKRWKSGKRRMGKNISSKLEGELNDEESSKRNFSHSGMAPVEDRTVVAHKIQDTNKMTVKATYNGVTIKFELSNLSGITELQDKVIERLQVERKCFSIKYQDDEGDWILIACDKDVQECIEISRSLKKTTIRMVIDPPIIHYAP